jgi:hypothetical protein
MFSHPVGGPSIFYTSWRRAYPTIKMITASLSFEKGALQTLQRPWYYLPQACRYEEAGFNLLKF